MAAPTSKIGPWVVMDRILNSSQFVQHLHMMASREDDNNKAGIRMASAKFQPILWDNASVKGLGQSTRVQSVSRSVGQSVSQSVSQSAN